jgi:hypothetical protein
MGYKLTPFSLRHMLYLQALNSPFLTMERIPAPKDVLVLLRICSSTHPSEAFTNVTIGDRIRMARMEVNTAYFFKNLLLIKSYIEACTTVPKTYEKPDDTHKVKENVPGPLSMATSLMSKLHMKKEEAWELTLGQAIWYLTAYAIGEGAEIKILTTEDEEKADAEREWLEKFQQSQLAKYKDNPNGTTER